MTAARPRVPLGVGHRTILTLRGRRSVFRGCRRCRSLWRSLRRRGRYRGRNTLWRGSCRGCGRLRGGCGWCGNRRRSGLRGRWHWLRRRSGCRHCCRSGRGCRFCLRVGLDRLVGRRSFRGGLRGGLRRLLVYAAVTAAGTLSTGRHRSVLARQLRRHGLRTHRHRQREQHRAGRAQQ